MDVWIDGFISESRVENADREEGKYLEAEGELPEVEEEEAGSGEEINLEWILISSPPGPIHLGGGYNSVDVVLVDGVPGMASFGCVFRFSDVGLFGSILGVVIVAVFPFPLPAEVVRIVAFLELNLVESDSSGEGKNFRCG